MKRLPSALFFIITFSFLLHFLGFLFVLSNKGTEALIYGDGKGYIELATNLRNGNGFVVATPQGVAEELYRTPGFPLILAPFMGSEKGLILYLFLLTISASIILPLLMFCIGRDLFGERVGLIGAVCIAFEPMLIFFSWLPLTEIPFLIVALVGTTLLVTGLNKNLYIHLAGAAVINAYAVLIRPGLLSLFVLALFVLVVFMIFKKERRKVFLLLCVFALFFATLFPWYARVHSITGEWSLSGVGWRTLYADFLPSIRAIKNKTVWIDERNYLKDVQSKELGLDRYSINNPANAEVLRAYIIPELLSNVPTIIKLETVLLISFFTNDGYYYTASNLGLIPRLSAHISPTKQFLDNGFSALPLIFDQLKGQFFIPVIGRLITLIMFIFAGIGVVRGVVDSRFRLAVLFAGIIGLAALSATAIGFGVEARIRISIMPLLFLLTAIGIDWTWKKKHLTY